MRRWGILAALALTTGCTIVPPGTGPRPSAPVAPPAGVTSAALAGVSAGPNFGSLGLRAADADTALASFRESCRWLLTRPDASGLTRPEDWRPACDAASTWPQGRGHDFFQQYFETA